MDYHHILLRIRAAVRRGSYLVPTGGVPPTQRAALREVAGLIASADADPEHIRQRIHQLEASGRIDHVMKLSALGVLAASPLVRDLNEAARLAGQQEFAALELGGPWRELYLASADRHRGVIAFLLGHDPVALDWFTRALERERSAENVGNVLAVLIRIGEIQEAKDLVARMRAALPDGMRAELEQRIAEDDDLVRLREPTVG
jgi:hypothetical protein